MSEKETVQKTQTLGEFLKKTRKASGVSLDEARESTKITQKILEAIERDDFSSMPAEAFSRGFYVMYAKFLKLDHEVVLERYLEARGLPPVASKLQSTPPVRKSGQFSNYAEPSPVSPFMSSIFALVIFLAAIVGGCWYFSWNPIDYLNSKLDSLQTQEQQLEISNDTSARTEQTTDTLIQDNTIVQEDLTETEDITTPTPYHLEILFRSEGTLATTIDKGFMIENQFQQGQMLQWEVKESIILDMPESIDATIRMNGIEIQLPEVENGHRLLSLPEDLLN
jgi:cytoskeletal protein RodZ